MNGEFFVAAVVTMRLHGRLLSTFCLQIISTFKGCHENRF